MSRVLPESGNPAPVHIVGAGIAGLGAAHFLARRGIPSIVYEADGQVGGRAGYAEAGGHSLEVGGKNFSTAWTHFTGLLAEFGLDRFDPQHSSFNIILAGRVMRLEKTRSLVNDWPLVRAIGPRGTWQFGRVLAEARAMAARLNHEGGLIEEIERRRDGASVAATFDHRLAYGPLRMFSIIMAAAEPDEIYPAQLLLLLSALGKGSHFAINGGIKRFFDRLAAGKDIRLGRRVERVAIENGRVRGLTLSGPDGREQVPAERVIVAVPLPVFARLVDLPSAVADAAARVRYFPLALINAAYDRDIFPETMTSLMFDPESHLGHCSANRAHERHLVRFTLSGRKARAVLDLPDDALIALAERDFSRYLPITGRRLFYHVRRHPGGICAYAPHFSGVRRRLLDHVETIGGLAIAGDYLDGHNMEGCLTAAARAADRIAAADVPTPP